MLNNEQLLQAIWKNGFVVKQGRGSTKLFTYFTANSSLKSILRMLKQIKNGKRAPNRAFALWDLSRQLLLKRNRNLNPSPRARCSGKLNNLCAALMIIYSPYGRAHVLCFEAGGAISLHACKIC